MWRELLKNDLLGVVQILSQAICLVDCNLNHVCIHGGDKAEVNLMRMPKA